MAVIDRERWQRLEPLLDRALELSDEDRTIWLAELRSQSPDVADELASLLSSEETADRRGFLSDPIDVSLAGLMLGAYTLERPLGQGGMGSVWLARRTDGRFEGKAAVKLLNQALLSAAGQERFRREGSALARLAHPGIARLMDAGVSASGQPYLVLEYVEGQRIDVFVKEQSLPMDARVRLALQILSAVSHAHANLIVHRDIKPSNILVTSDGTAKLLDFGIAKLITAESSTEVAPVTVDGGGALTPEFAAPEQVRGDAVTTATDVYACGVLLYLLLSGKHPTGEGSNTPAEAIGRLFEVEPKRLGLGDLDTVLAKSLQKAPANRYQTAAAFADDLERLLRHEPVTARRDSVAYRARKFVRRNRIPVIAGALTAAGLLAATLVSVNRMREARLQRDAALYERQRADAQVQFQNLLLSEIGDQPLTMRQMLDRGRTVLERQYAGQPEVLRALLLQLASQYADLNDTRSQAAVLARAESLTVAGVGENLLPAIRCYGVENLRLQGRYEEAERALTAAASLVPSAPSPRNRIACLTAQGNLGVETKHGDSSIVAARAAIAIKDSLGETRDAEYMELFNLLGLALAHTGRSREALRYYERAISGMDSSGRGGTLDRVIVLHNLGLALTNLGETAQAERVLRESLDRATRTNASGHVPMQPVVHYAEAALVQGHADSALKYFRMLAAQGVRDTSLFWEGRGLFGVARAQVQLGRFAEARPAQARLERIIIAYPQVRGTDDQLPAGRTIDGLIAAATGDTTAARIAFRAVLDTNAFFSGKRQKQLRPVALLLAEMELALGRPAEALKLARQALEISTVDSLALGRSTYVGEAYLVEGRVLLATGDTTAARAALTRAVTALRTGAGAEHARTRQAESLLARPSVRR